MNREALGTTLRLLNRERGAADTLPKSRFTSSSIVLTSNLPNKIWTSRFRITGISLVLSLSYALDCPLSQY